MNLFEIMNNLKGLQSKMEEMNRSLNDKVETGESGAGAVQITMNCKFEVKSVQISDELATSQNKQLLEELVTSALTATLAKIRDRIKQELSSVGGGMPFPPGFMG